MSNEFWLYPDGVTDQARAFSGWAEMAASAKTWITNHPLTDPGGHPAYTRGVTPAIEIREGLIAWFGHLEQVLTGVATELCDVAEEGRTIDLEQLAEIDKINAETYLGFDQTYYGTGGLLPEDERVEEKLPWWPPPNGGAAFYCDRGSYANLNDFERTLLPDDLLSPSEWVWTVLGWVGAQDISTLVLNAFGGRWGDMYVFVDTLKGLSTMLGDMHGNLTSASAYINELWQGVAATSAQKYFAALLEAISEAQQAMSTAGDAFSSYCTGVVQQADAIEGLLHTFTNLVIAAAVAAALGTATIETVVGGILGYGTAGAALLGIYLTLYDIRGKLQDIELLYDILVALGNTYTTLTDFTTKIPVPTMVEAP